MVTGGNLTYRFGLARFTGACDSELTTNDAK